MLIHTAKRSLLYRRPRYAVSMQTVAITIGTGATSNTATISRVSGNAFILFNGMTCTDTSTANDIYARIELTDTVTVTATRNTSSASKTVTVYATVFDCTSALIKSVQSGTIVYAAGDSSKTATITSVNTSCTAVHLLGCITSQAAPGFSNIDSIIELTNATTITGSRLFSGPTETLGFVAIEFQPWVVKSLQQVKCSFTSSATTNDTAITAIDINNSLAFYAGQNSNTTQFNRTHATGQIQSATNFRCTYATAGFVACLYNTTLVEFVPGILKRAVQRGTITIAAASTTGTATLEARSPDVSLTNFNGWTSSNANATTMDSCFLYAQQKVNDPFTINSGRTSSTGSATIGYESAEFN